MNLIYLPHYEWALVLFSVFSLWCLSWVKPRFGILPTSFLLFLVGNAVWFWVWVENRYYPLNPYDQTAIRYFASDSLSRLLLILAPFMVFSENRNAFSMFGEIAAWFFVIVNSLLVVKTLALSGCSQVNACGGMGNPSIMMGLAVCLLPIVLKSWKRQWILFALVAAAVVASKSSIALGLLAIYIASSLIKQKAVVYALAAAPVPLVIGGLILGKSELLNSSDRFMIWQYMMPMWATVKNMIAGTGWGTYHVFSINMQAVHKVAAGSYWDTLHNDWLQMLFECGFIGALLMVATYSQALLKSMKEKDFSLALAILLYGIYLGCNPALHHAIPAAFGAWLFVYALRKPLSPRRTI